MGRIKKSPHDIAVIVKAHLHKTLLSLVDNLLSVKTLVGIAYFTAFAGLIFSVCKLGVDGDILYGIYALICAVVILIIGFATGTF